jgi:hypothetical protein
VTRAVTTADGADGVPVIVHHGKPRAGVHDWLVDRYDG